VWAVVVGDEHFRSIWVAERDVVRSDYASNATINYGVTPGLALCSCDICSSLGGVLLVPDGVASIKLGRFTLSHEVAGLNTRAFNAALATLHGTAIVHGNIAAFQLAIPSTSAGARLLLSRNSDAEPDDSARFGPDPRRLPQRRAASAV
jgi:hypothetical protein